MSVAHNYLSQEDSKFDSSKFLKALVIPRPIAFVTSLSSKGIVNAAPFSYFNIVCTDPCLIYVSVGRRNGIRKDTAENIILNREFVVNICPNHFAENLDLTSQAFASDVSEIDIAKLELLPSTKISTPRVAGTLAQLECVMQQVIPVGNDPVDMILAEVVNIHVVKEVIDATGSINRDLFKPIARCIGSKYWHQ